MSDLVLNLLLISLGFVLAALVAGNNLSVCFGGVISSRVIKRHTGVILTIIGYISGLLLKGGLLGATTSALIPSSNTTIALETALGISIVIFVVSQIKRVPQSLSITLTAVLVGADLALGVSLPYGFLGYIIGFWVMMPIVSSVAVIYIMRIWHKRRMSSDIWSYIKVIKPLLIISSFFVAFTLGSNTIGLIMDLMPPGEASVLSIVLGTIAGGVILNAGTLRRIGNDIIPLRYMNAASSQLVSAIMVEIATVYGIPLSNTQTFVSSVYAAGVSYKNRLIKKRPFITMTAMWVATAVVGLVSGFVMIRVLI